MTKRTPNAEHRFAAVILSDPDLMALLAAVRSLRLPQWRLVAGCLYQTVWNALTGRTPGTGIKDYDLIYFDASDVFPGRPRTTSSIALRRQRVAASALLRRATALPVLSHGLLDFCSKWAAPLKKPPVSFMRIVLAIARRVAVATISSEGR